MSARLMLGLAFAAVATVSSAQPARVSVSSFGALGNGDSFNGVISFDGRYVAFLSTASNLDVVGPDTNNLTDVFRHDRATGETIRASLPPSTTTAFDDDLVQLKAITLDGRYLLFISGQTDLVPNDTNGTDDVFVYDWSTGEVERVSVASDESQGNGASTLEADITPDGRFVVFQSRATNFSPIDNGATEDIFLRDRTAGETRHVSVGVGNTPANGFSIIPQISPDGGFIVYSSQATNLTAAPDTNNERDIYMYEVATGVTTRVSVGDNEAEGNGQAQAGDVSQGGRYVAFQSRATNLVAGDANGEDDIFVRDTQAGTTTRVNLSSTGAQATGFTFFQPLNISAGGRYVLFESNDTSLVPGTRQQNSLFVRDRTATTTLLAGELVVNQRGQLSGNGRYVVYDTRFDNRVNDAAGVLVDVFVNDLNVPEDAGDLTDADSDGLPTSWEQRYGLDPLSSVGPNGANGDPDNDSRTNAQEFAAGTHPRGLFTRYFAEGATSTFFDTRLALLNVGTASAAVLIRFQKADGTTVPHDVPLPALRRGHVDVKSILGAGTSEFSTVLESDQPIVADRTMEWDATGYGSHAETSVSAPATTWFLAEGATHSGFSLFYLVQNPDLAQVAQVRVTYLLPSGSPLEKVYTVAPRSRFNIWVNDEARTDPALAALASTDVSATFEVLNNVPVIVERAMYLDTGGRTFGAGHESAGVTAAATEWFLAEGATGQYFDLFVLVANPGNTDAVVQATFLLTGGGTVVKSYPVPAKSRFNIWVDFADPLLADTAVSTIISSTNGVPIIVERAMWWPGSIATWDEAHNSAGLTSTGRRWALAEGEEGGSRGYETYILIANRGAADIARVTLYYEDGTSDTKDVAIPANSRTNVPVRTDFPNAMNKRFAAVVEALGSSPQIVVERAMYSNANDVTWAAGTNAVATKLQ